MNLTIGVQWPGALGVAGAEREARGAQLIEVLGVKSPQFERLCDPPLGI